MFDLRNNNIFAFDQSTNTSYTIILDNNIAWGYNQPPQYGDHLHPSDSNNTIVPDVSMAYDQRSQFDSGGSHFHSEILKRLGDVIERQDIMIQQLVESNLLLKEMAKKF